MTTSIMLRRDYLAGQRRTILARSIAGSLAGLVPVPFLDDWAKLAVMGGGYRRIAGAHGVDLDDDAVKSLVHGKASQVSPVEIAASSIAYRIAGRTAKRMMLALATINRARAVSRSFVTMTLFDHYCARLHTGPALDAATALALQAEIEAAIAQTPGALALHPFRRGALAAARATVRAPLELLDLASGGRVRRLLAKRAGPPEVTEPETVDDLEQSLAAALDDQQSFLARTVTAIETQLSAEGNPFLDGAIEALDRRWRARVAAGLE